ncbi:EH domain-containing protein 3-like [Tigriopus californicus]|uniref:EH domain-containing protein 3-like n=1 Tax=Tigriopus californicus TaxID=6832 RepID=UPI0027D9D098|nr:EH domain-containing protein 3-like [Tigriopus californicus]
MANFFRKSRSDQPKFYATVGEGLKKVYKTKLLPLEEAYDFHEFVSPQLNDPDFDAKPMILLVGQYSTGKTSFIRYLLERDYPGLRIGPEPTTDCFNVVMYGDQEQVIPGNALAVDNKRQFRPLSKFGGAFLNRFQCSTLKNPVLRCVTMIDTPGILSGEKQRVDRGYDFVGVLQWFAERVDRIILLFDANKLDISDEFRRSIHAIHGYEDKVRIVLNKADQVDHHELMRVYGALMWSISKVISVPECPKVFVGSFWDQQLKHDLYRKLFERELQLLFDDLQDLPKYAALRKINDLIKRARMAKIHAYILSSLRKDMPRFFGKGRKKKELIRAMPIMFKRVQEEHMVSASDIPPVELMQEKLAGYDFMKFPHLREKLIQAVDQMLDNDIAELMSIVPQDSEETPISGGAFDDVKDTKSPFGYQKCEGIDLGSGEPEWIVAKERSKWDLIFKELNPVNGKVMGSTAKKEMVKSRLPNPVLAKVWRLADVDKDGALDEDEFALAMHLINVKLDGFDMPDELPDHLIPPSKKHSLYSNTNGNSIPSY